MSWFNKKEKTYQEIIDEIHSNLGENKKENIKYLKEQAERYKKHSMANEILKEIGRLFTRNLDEEKLKELNSAIESDVTIHFEKGIPTAVDGKCFVLVDCGANADCKPINLQHFAIMGSCYVESLFGVQNPTVAILSNGQEKGKGNELVKETYPILEGTKSINFVGNVEARDILSGDYDVVVCDGFSGNVALKTIEGTALCVMKMIKDSIKNGSLLQKIGGLLIKPAVRKLKSTMDVNEQAGGTVLGVDGIIVKAHGSSKQASICRCIEQAMLLINNNIVQKIKENLSGLEENDNQEK